MSFRVHAGDVFFTRSESLLGKAIRWVERDPDEEKSWANHDGVVVKDGWITPCSFSETDVLAKVVEALWKVRHHTFWSHYKDQTVIVEVWRRSFLTPRQVQRVTEYARNQEGNKYGWWKLLPHALDRFFFGGKKRVSKLLHIDKRPICSYLVAKAYSLIKIDFGGRAQAMDPDEMHDWVVLNHNWEFVGREELNQD